MTPRDNAGIEGLVTTLTKSVEDLESQLTDTHITLEGMSERLKGYVSQADAEENVRSVRKWLAGLLVGGMIVASTLGATLYLNHGVTCGVRSILVLAQSASTRNPLPADLSPEARAEAEARRENARQFYSDALDKLNIIWPCAGESSP